MKKCNKCGVAVQDKATFCHFCGNDLRTKSAENANETKIIDDTVDLNMAEKAQATNGKEPTAGQVKNTNGEKPTAEQVKNTNGEKPTAEQTRNIYQENVQMGNQGVSQHPPYSGMPYPPQYPYPPYPPMNQMNNMYAGQSLNPPQSEKRTSVYDDYVLEEAETAGKKLLKAILAIVIVLVGFFTINSFYKGELLELEYSRSGWYGYDDESTEKFDYDEISEKYEIYSNFQVYVIVALFFVFGASVIRSHKALYVIAALFTLIAILSVLNINLEMKEAYEEFGWYENAKKSWSWGPTGKIVLSGLFSQLGMIVFALFGIRH